MKTNAIRCALCGGPQESGTTIFAVDLKFGVLVVRDVPARLCSQCGEAWIEDPVAARLEAVVGDARRKQALVEVVQWQPTAA
ncbi:MAG: type II toxin-antitoxin system MqsA family antitoxin [Candidatus Schekmanbacteria bacterium]|nr:type II toxin-antitoxin system MqsA family antitoxin [Candidatus Schekmanbacteria bacterium]